MYWLRWHYHVIAGAPYKIKKKSKQKRQNRRQSVVAGRQQLYCAVQSRSPNHCQTTTGMVCIRYMIHVHAPTTVYIPITKHYGNIFDDDDYTVSLIRAGLDTLETRREQLTERFFMRSVLPETSCLHYLLPDKRDVSVTDRLRQAKTFQYPHFRTVKSRNSFIPYCLHLYD